MAFNGQYVIMNGDADTRRTSYVPNCMALLQLLADLMTFSQWYYNDREYSGEETYQPR